MKTFTLGNYRHRKCSFTMAFLMLTGLFFMASPIFSQEKIIYSEGFESSNGGYTKIVEPVDPNYSNFGDVNWEWGTSTWVAPHSGIKCWGTNFSSEMPSGTGSIVSPAISLASVTSNQYARVSFWANFDISMSGRARFYVSSDGDNWTKLSEFFMDMNGGWNRYELDISNYRGGNIFFKFWVTDEGNNRGFYVDDIAITTYDKSSVSKVFTMEARESSEGSCPWVYTWDGNSYVKDNDIYSVARFPRGEYRDYYLLQKPLVEKDGKYLLQINEIASEESFTDLTNLIAVDHASDVKIANDNKGNIFAYKPANLIAPIGAISNSGVDVLNLVNTDNMQGFDAYSQDYVDVDFGNIDLTKGGRLVLKIKGFNDGTGANKPFIGPPAIVVQGLREGVWVELGRSLPRFDWSECVFDVTTNSVTDMAKFRLMSISHGKKYHIIDYVAMEVGAEPEKTIVNAPLSKATFNGNSVIGLLSESDNSYVHLLPGNHMNLEFRALPQTSSTRSFVFVSEGYYVPRGNTFFIYTWDGSNWVNRDSYTYSTEDETRTFDLSPFLPDANNEMKVRVWQDYSESYYADIDLVKLQVDQTVGVLETAIDLRNNEDIKTYVDTSDDNRFTLGEGFGSTGSRDRWAEFSWSGFTLNAVPVCSNLQASCNTLSWDYTDAENDPQAKALVQVWSSSNGSGTLLWCPDIITGTQTSINYAGTALTNGQIFYLRVKVFDGNNWSQWVEYEGTYSGPSAPVSIDATSKTATSFDANWNSVASAIGYFLDVSSNANFSSFVSGFENKDVGNVTTYNISGLSEGVLYYYRVRAFNGTCSGGNSNVVCSSSSLIATGGATVYSIYIPVYIASDITATGAIFNGATVSISNNFVIDEDVLGVNGATSGTEGTLEYSYDFATGILSFTGEATAAQFQAIFRKITYANMTVSPSPNVRTVTFSFAPNQPSLSDDVLVNINYPEVTLTVTDLGQTQSQNGELMYIAKDAALIAWGLTNAEISITKNFTSGEDYLGIQGETYGSYPIGESATIDWNFDDVNGILTISGDGSAAQYQSIFRNLTYSLNASNPSNTSPRTIRISLSPNIPEIMDSVTVNLNVPESKITATAETKALPQNEALYFASDATVSGWSCENFRVSISSNYDLNEDFLGIDGQDWYYKEWGNNWIYCWYGYDGTIYFDAQATAAQFQEVLRLIYYENTSSSPSGNAKTITVSFGYDPVISTEVIILPNNPTKPISLAATNITSSSFDANWYLFTNATEYFLDVATIYDFSTFVEGYKTKKVGNVASWNIGGLNEAANYYYRVRALVGTDTTDYSSVVSVLTKTQQTITFEPLSEKTYGDSPFSLTGTSSSNLQVVFTSSDETVATISGNEVTIVSAGTTTITAHQIGDENYNEADDVEQILTVNKASALVAIESLSHVYDGSGKTVTVTTDPINLAVDITYEGSSAAPVDAGTYSVVATVNEKNYQGTKTETLTIDKATATIEITNITQVYTGIGLSVTVTTIPANLSVEVKYNGSTTLPINPGNYDVAVTVNETNYQGSQTATLQITPGTYVDPNKMNNVVIFSDTRYIYIDIPSLDNSARVEVYDILGKQVYNSMDPIQGRNKIERNFISGTYIVKMINGNKVFTKKVIIGR
jgi:hypothetical protein